MTSLDLGMDLAGALASVGRGGGQEGWGTRATQSKHIEMRDRVYQGGDFLLCICNSLGARIDDLHDNALQDLVQCFQAKLVWLVLLQCASLNNALLKLSSRYGLAFFFCVATLLKIAMFPRTHTYCCVGANLFICFSTHQLAFWRRNQQGRRLCTF